MPNSWYVNPNTNIKILTGIPLDNTYEHTIYFSNRGDQFNYFSARVRVLYDLTAQSYQRVQRSKMRVNINAENLYNANYLMFQNAAFGNKWFYAFITSVEYINDAVSEIAFEIDVMQTWLEGTGLDYVLEECYVEREHTQTDVLFENLVEEHIDFGSEYVVNAEDSFDMSDMRVLVMINRDTDTSGQMPGTTINGIYSPVYIIDGLPPSQPNVIDSAISQYLEDEIICVYQYPHFLDSSPTQAKAINKNTSSLNGYTPRNKKLFNYPYNFLLVSNNCGQTANYRWEDFNSASALFTIYGVKISTPAVLCYPRYYRGLNEGFDDGIIYSNFPECAWSGDTFKAWWAQNKASFVTSGLIGAVESIRGASESKKSAADAVVDASVSIAEIAAMKAAQVMDVKAMPNQTHGKTQTDSLNPAMGRVKFSFYNMCIKSAYAAIIDDFFDRYGYACRRNKVPNTHVRPHWTFTKTLGCCIRGSVPADDMRKICSIYDRGITFWLNGSEVGDYSLNNTV